MESIHREQWLKAKELARKRQKRFKRQVKVLVASGTWIYVPKEVAKSKRKLKKFLAERTARMQQKAQTEAQILRERQERSKASFKANEGQRREEVRKIMSESNPI